MLFGRASRKAALGMDAWLVQLLVALVLGALTVGAFLTWGSPPQVSAAPIPSPTTATPAGSTAPLTAGKEKGDGGGGDGDDAAVLRNEELAARASQLGKTLRRVRSSSTATRRRSVSGGAPPERFRATSPRPVSVHMGNVSPHKSPKFLRERAENATAPVAVPATAPAPVVSPPSPPLRSAAVAEAPVRAVRRSAPLPETRGGMESEVKARRHLSSTSLLSSESSEWSESLPLRTLDEEVLPIVSLRHAPRYDDEGDGKGESGGVQLWRVCAFRARLPAPEVIPTLRADVVQTADVVELNIDFESADRAREVLLLLPPTLRGLDVSACASKHALTGDVWKAAGKHFSQLTELNATGCVEVDDKAVKHMARCGGKHLARLDLSWCRQVQDGALKALRDACPNLRALSLHHCTVTDAGLKVLAKSKHARTLRELNISSCAAVTDAGVTLLAARSPALRVLDVSWLTALTDVSMRTLGEHCPRLGALNVERCKKLTNRGVAALTAGCASLHTISLGHCESISDGALGHLRQCAQLRDVNVRFCGNITDRGLRYLSECHELRSVDLQGTEVTSDGVRELAIGAPLLTSIDLRGCDKLTSSGVEALAERCPDLHTLRLGSVFGCSVIVDDTVRAISRRCNSLRTLRLEGCWGVSATAVTELSEHNPELELDVIACKQR